MADKKRNFKGIWIPVELLNLDMSVAKKMIIAEVDHLDKGRGCYAKLNHFAKHLSMRKSSVSRLISALEIDGFLIKESFINDQNSLQLLLKVNESNANLLPFLKARKASLSIENTEGFLQETGGFLSATGCCIQETLIEEENTYKETTTTRDLYKYVFTEKEGIEILTNTAQYVESIMSNNKLKKKETVSKAAARFVKFQLSIGKEYNNRVDFMNHFSSWTRSQGLVDETVTPEDIDAGVAWFIKVFNAISKKDYKVTPAIRELFAVQLGNGFTGDEMQKAIENLYSGQNTWHKKNKYVEATPEFLLVNDRLNKFLNAKY